MTEESICVRRYIGLFAATYAGVMIVLNVLLHGLEIDLGSGGNIAMLFGAGFVVVGRFVSQNKRAPNRDEKRKLVLGSLAASFIISFLGIVVLLQMLGGSDAWAEMGGLLTKLPAAIWIAIFLAIVALYYALLNLIYGLGARQLAGKVNR